MFAVADWDGGGSISVTEFGLYLGYVYTHLQTGRHKHTHTLSFRQTHTHTHTHTHTRCLSSLSLSLSLFLYLSLLLSLSPTPAPPFSHELTVSLSFRMPGLGKRSKLTVAAEQRVSLVSSCFSRLAAESKRARELLVYNVFLYYSMCSLTIECVLII